MIGNSASTHPVLLRILWFLPVLVAALSHAPAHAISVGAFGPSGAGGTVNGQTFSFGSGGEVFELDAFVGVQGSDLNGSFAGTTAQLSLDALPGSLSYAFSSSLSADATDLTLVYEFSNVTSTAIHGVSFYSFLDAEIDEFTTSFFNEFATTTGTLATGQSFEVDEPGFVFGDIFDNLQQGALDDTNALPPGSSDDVAMALGFEIGTIGIDEIARIEILLSEDGGRLGPFAIEHRDDALGSDDVLTYSGRSTLLRPTDPPSPAVPEPTAGLLFGVGVTVYAASRPRHR